MAAVLLPAGIALALGLIAGTRLQVWALLPLAAAAILLNEACRGVSIGSSVGCTLLVVSLQLGFLAGACRNGRGAAASD